MASQTASSDTAPRQRDIRLDFFRGLGMFIIYLAHTPNNVWTLWIPARFGFSDATEIFVFCSGVASSIAFFKVFDRYGWGVGTARVAFRVWQVYWAHVLLFIAVAALLAAVDTLGGLGTTYKDSLGITRFFLEPELLLPGYLTLTYVPNYFDILPMYLVILALMPLVVGLMRVSPLTSMAFVGATWLVASFGYLDLPAEPWSDRTWFFNPFSWQLVFYTGFFIGLGFVRPPRPTRGLVLACVAFLLLTVPIAWYRARYWLDVLPLLDWWQGLQPLRDKTHFGILRYLHFLALAYLAWLAAGDQGRRLLAVPRLVPLVNVVRRVGQQSLAVFLLSMFLARVAGMVLDLIGRTHLHWALVNLTGFAVIALAAYMVGWFKSTPWKRPLQSGQPRSASGGALATRPVASGPER